MKNSLLLILISLQLLTTGYTVALHWRLCHTRRLLDTANAQLGVVIDHAHAQHMARLKPQNQDARTQNRK